MASWQAELLGMVFRLTVKPLVGANASVESLRRTAGLLGKGITSLPPDTQLEPIRLGTCTAEWINVPDCDPRRVILYIPGGTYAMHIPDPQRALAARLSREACARSLLVNYRLAPEAPFPAGLRDCVSAYRYLLLQDIRPEHIVIGGESAGGGMVLSTLFMLRDEGLPLPAGAFCMSPVTDLNDVETGSRRENRWVDPTLRPDGIVRMRSAYVNHRPEAITHPYVSPVYGDYRGIPPLLFQVGSTEILRDDSVKVAERAQAAGVRVEVEIWERMPHGWHLAPFVPEAKRAVARLGEFIRERTVELGLGPSFPTRDWDIATIRGIACPGFSETH